MEQDIVISSTSVIAPGNGDKAALCPNGTDDETVVKIAEISITGISDTASKTNSNNKLATRPVKAAVKKDKPGQPAKKGRPPKIQNKKQQSDDMKVSSSSDNNEALVSEESANSKNEVEKVEEPKDANKSANKDGNSSSSTVRRSNRIKTIDLMKQKSKSKGRGLVTKPVGNVVAKDGSVSERDKVSSSTSLIVPEKDSTSKSESMQVESGAPQDEMNPIAIVLGQSGTNSEVNKPVKVKSRWRRSSELEMNNSPIPGFSNQLIPVSNTGSALITCVPNVVSKLPPVPPNSSMDLELQLVGNHESVQNNISDNIVLTSSSTPQSNCTVKEEAPPMNIAETPDEELKRRLEQFLQIKESIYMTDRISNKDTKLICDCFLTEEETKRGELGCGEDCLNRLLMIECGSRCVVGDRCTNKRFQNCSYSSCEVFRTEKKGFGLKASAALNAGDFIMEYVGEVLTPKDFHKRAREYSKDKNQHYYFMALKSDQIIDATAKGNVSRFINHSCDPNSETQKWTVNGELRIGFFTKKFVALGEEITFDYHFQRYGKEAQRCYCESSNCRGWIGETPDEHSKNQEDDEGSEEEDDEEEEEEEQQETEVTKSEKPVRRRVRKKKVQKQIDPDYMEDEDLEEEINKLSANGLKNRTHTLALSRLMVRSREMHQRTRLLKIIQCGEQPCRRLFLDYRGLRLLWSYMMDVAGDPSPSAEQYRLEILKALNSLPIPNKTMLIDSKVWDAVDKWSRRFYESQGDSPPDDEATKLKPGLEKPPEDSPIAIKEEEEVRNEIKTEITENDMKSESTEIRDDVIIAVVDNEDETVVKKSDVEAETKGDEDVEVKNEPDADMKEDVKLEVFDETLVPQLANEILSHWSNLKEVFRIPKKERIEQMKEHEREADQGYKDDAYKEVYPQDRYSSDRYNNSLVRRPEKRRPREVPDFDYNKFPNPEQERYYDDRDLLQVPIQMSKHERRQLFAMKVAKEEQEKQKRIHLESWKKHEAQCMLAGVDPYTSPAYDSRSGCPLIFNHSIGRWQPYPMPGVHAVTHADMSHYYHSTYASVNQQQQQLQPPPPRLQPPPPDVSPAMQYPPAMPLNNQQQLHYPPQPIPVHYTPDNQTPLLSHTPTPVYNNTPPPPLPLGPPPAIKKVDATPPPLKVEEVKEPKTNEIEKLEDLVIDLPPGWKWARDSRKRIYFYHMVERISHWLPPPPDHLFPPSSSSSGTSESEDEEEEEENEEVSSAEDEIEAQLKNMMEPEDSTKANKDMLQKMDGINGYINAASVRRRKKRIRDGLVQEKIISPRREEDRVDHRRFKEIKEKLRRHKEQQKKLKEMREYEREKLKQLKHISKTRIIKLKGSLSPTSGGMSPNTERKIKDNFRANMANTMVQILNPYRKRDCKQGRITNNGDFKHLARKLTHFVLAKELKRCKSVDELQCNDNVKHKAKEFVRKYMGKYGAEYQKSVDEE